MKLRTCSVCDIMTTRLSKIWLNYDETDSGAHNLRNVCRICYAWHHNHDTPLNNHAKRERERRRTAAQKRANQYAPPPETKP